MVWGSHQGSRSQRENGGEREGLAPKIKNPQMQVDSMIYSNNFSLVPVCQGESQPRPAPGPLLGLSAEGLTLKKWGPGQQTAPGRPWPPAELRWVVASCRTGPTQNPSCTWL